MGELQNVGEVVSALEIIKVSPCRGGSQAEHLQPASS